MSTARRRPRRERRIDRWAGRGRWQAPGLVGRVARATPVEIWGV